MDDNKADWRRRRTIKCGRNEIGDEQSDRTTMAHLEWQSKVEVAYESCCCEVQLDDKKDEKTGDDQYKKKKKHETKHMIDISGTYASSASCQGLQRRYRSSRKPTLDAIGGS